MYLVIAILSLGQLINSWGNFDQKFFIFAGFMVVSFVMYFVRRRYRMRLEEHHRNKEDKE